MKTYLVSVSRTAYQTTTVYIEAESPEAARTGVATQMEEGEDQDYIWATEPELDEEITNTLEVVT